MIFVEDITQSLGGHNPLMVSVGKHVDREDEHSVAQANSSFAERMVCDDHIDWAARNRLTARDELAHSSPS